MCELMGMSFARPISADFSIREFAPRGEENADGWGLAWYPDRSLALVREPAKSHGSKYIGFLESYQGLRSCIYVAHVRHRTMGGLPTHADTHPFGRELGGREYAFAHNGTIEGHASLTLGRFRPIGSTDSEHVFCHVLGELAGGYENLSSAEGWHWLHQKLGALNHLGRLNCLLADGERLYCYRDAAGWKGLTFRRVHIDAGETRRLEDPTLTVDLEGGPINHGVVVATRPLTGSGWQSFEPGELMVLERGEMRFSSHRRAPAAGAAADSAAEPGNS